MTKLTRDQEIEIDNTLDHIISVGIPLSTRSHPQQIFDMANSFHLGGIRCSNDEIKKDGGHRTATAPSICNYAFACELYLKSLLNNVGKKPRSHDLSKLFSLVDDADKASIKSMYATITNRTAGEFEIDMKQISNAFVDWRYIFEAGKTRISMARLVNITRSIYIYMCAKFPDWLVDGDLNTILRSEPNAEIISIINLGGGIMIRARFIPDL